MNSSALIFFENHLQDLLSSQNSVISTNKSTQFITGHVIYNPAYTYKFQLKTTFTTTCNKLEEFYHVVSLVNPFELHPVTTILLKKMHMF